MITSLENYAEDRERLLLNLRRKGVRGWVPAQLVREAILECKWRIERVHGLNERLLGLCCPEVSVLRIPVDFRQRLRVPKTAAAVLNETLAHELGHIRLHARQMLQEGVKKRSWEREADDYARVFLVPLVSLLGHSSMTWLLRAESQQQLWAQVLRLAEEFRVTGWFMGSVLEMYGLIRIERRRRLIEVLPEAHSLNWTFALGWLA